VCVCVGAACVNHLWLFLCARSREPRQDFVWSFDHAWSNQCDSLDFNDWLHPCTPLKLVLCVVGKLMERQMLQEQLHHTNEAGPEDGHRYVSLYYLDLLHRRPPSQLPKRT